MIFQALSTMVDDPFSARSNVTQDFQVNFLSLILQLSKRQLHLKPKWEHFKICYAYTINWINEAMNMFVIYFAIHL